MHQERSLAGRERRQTEKREHSLAMQEKLPQPVVNRPNLPTLPPQMVGARHLMVVNRVDQAKVVELNQPDHHQALAVQQIPLAM